MRCGRATMRVRQFRVTFIGRLLRVSLPPPCCSQFPHDRHDMGIRRPLSRLSALSFFAMLEHALAQNYPSSRALIYSATADFRHDSITTAIESLKAQGPSYNVRFDQTEDRSWFTDERLAQYDAVVFLSNTGQGETAASSTVARRN